MSSKPTTEITVDDDHGYVQQGNVIFCGDSQTFFEQHGYDEVAMVEAALRLTRSGQSVAFQGNGRPGVLVADQLVYVTVEGNPDDEWDEDDDA